MPKKKRTQRNPATAKRRPESVRERRASAMERLRAWLVDPVEQAKAARIRGRAYRSGGFPP